MTWQTTLRRNVLAEMTRGDITHDEVGRWLGMTRGAVQRRLKGDVEFRIGELLTIAHTMNMTLEDLLGRTEDEFSREQQSRGVTPEDDSRREEAS